MSLTSAYREPVDPPGVDAFRPKTKSDEQAPGVNGQAFDKEARIVNHAAIPDVPGLDDEPFPALKPWQHAASGAVIMEPDGRIWVVAPRGGYAGYDNTFPKGTVDKGDGLTMQQNAHKEVQEESGLCMKLKGVVGDFAGDQSVTRYYLAERVGGSPYHHDGVETEAVKLATPEQLRAMLNKKRDKNILHATLEKFTTAGTKISAASPLGRAIKPKRDDALNISKWKKVGGSLGSNPGGLYEDDSGERWYVKHSKSDDHARNEVLAAALYKAAGSPVLDYHLTKDASGKLGTATPWVDKKAFDPNSPAASTKVQTHFATHAWLANWDAVGLVFDNQAIVGGKMTTLDTGGALRYRAQGSPKLFSEHPTEWSSLRDSAKNPQAAAVFGKMTDHQLADSAAAVAGVPDGVIDELVKKFGPTDPTEKAKLATTLKARKRAIRSNGAATAAPANPFAITAAPPPVKVTSVAQAVTYQPKFDAVHTAATTLSPADALAKISAIESNPNSKVTWGRKFHAYKTLALSALGAGPGTSDRIHAADNAGILAAIENALHDGWLGNPKTVHAIVALYVEANFVAFEKFFADTIEKPELFAEVEAAELAAARVLLGEDSNHKSMVGWNQPGGIDDHIAKVLNIAETDPTRRVRLALRNLWSEISELTVQEMQGMPLENTRWQMDLAVNETVRLFLGLSREQDQSDE